MSAAAKAKTAEHAISLQTNANAVAFEYDSLEEAFPLVDPGRETFAHNILVQIRQPKSQTKGGILLTQADRSTEHYNTRVAKVIALGPLCFTSTHTAEVVPNAAGPRFVSELVPWPEGPWFKPGDFVEIPQYGGARFVMPFQAMRMEFDMEQRKKVPTPVTEEATFAFFKAKDILGRITIDPRLIRSYLD